MNNKSRKDKKEIIEKLDTHTFNPSPITGRVCQDCGFGESDQHHYWTTEKAKINEIIDKLNEK